MAAADPNSQTLQVIDSHTAGEPTRVVVSGFPDLGAGTVAECLHRVQERHDWIRRSVILEPRGSDVMVGALLLPPHDPRNDCGVIFFNNVGYLHMCGHGTMGLVATLRRLGRLRPGTVRIETSVGIVQAELLADGRVSLRNVPSRCLRQNVRLEAPGAGVIHADVAWGGNWFLLVEDHGLEIHPRNVAQLTQFSTAILAAAGSAGIKSDDGREIDHVELFGPPASAEADSKNFVLCPGGAYDRSPCGTGTSAKLACLYAKGKLQPGQTWRQAGILDTVFEGSIAVENGEIIPTVTGRAFVNGETRILFDPQDPFRHGILPSLS